MLDASCRGVHDGWMPRAASASICALGDRCSTARHTQLGFAHDRLSCRGVHEGAPLQFHLCTRCPMHHVSRRGVHNGWIPRAVSVSALCALDGHIMHSATVPVIWGCRAQPQLDFRALCFATAARLATTVDRIRRQIPFTLVSRSRCFTARCRMNAASRLQSHLRVRSRRCPAHPDAASKEACCAPLLSLSQRRPPRWTYAEQRPDLYCALATMALASRQRVTLLPMSSAFTGGVRSYGKCIAPAPCFLSFERRRRAWSFRLRPSLCTICVYASSSSARSNDLLRHLLFEDVALLPLSSGVCARLCFLSLPRPLGQLPAVAPRGRTELAQAHDAPKHRISRAVHSESVSHRTCLPFEQHAALPRDACVEAWPCSATYRRTAPRATPAAAAGPCVPVTTPFVGGTVLDPQARVQ